MKLHLPKGIYRAVVAWAVIAAAYTCGAGEVLEWNGAKSDVWTVDGDPFWKSGLHYVAYQDGDTVEFENGGTVTLAGIVRPGEIWCDIDKNLSFKTTYRLKGTIDGTGALFKMGKAALTISTDNAHWTGNLTVEGGTLKAGHDKAFGSGQITISRGATLDLGNKAIDNSITVQGSGVIKSGKKFTGSLELSGDLLKGSSIDIKSGETVTLKSGSVSGEIRGEGTAVVDGMARVEGKLLINTLKLNKDSKLTVGAKGLSMGKYSALTLMPGATLALEGKLTTHSLHAEQASVLTSGYKATTLTFKGNIRLDDCSTMVVNGNVKAEGLTLASGSSYTLQSASSRSLTLKEDLSLTDSSMTLNGKLSAANLIMYTNDGAPQDASLTLMGRSSQSISLKEDATLTHAELAVDGKFAAVDLNMNDSTLKVTGFSSQSLSLKGTAMIEASELVVGGKLKAENIHLTDSVLTMSATASQSLDVKNTLALTSSGMNTRIDLVGKLKAQNLMLNPGTHVNVYGPRAYDVAAGETLTIGSGATLTLNGKLSAGNLVMDNGAGLVMNGRKLQTIKVKGNLNLQGGFIDLSAFDFKENKVYTIITFKSYSGLDDIDSIFGVTEGSGCILDMTGSSITLRLATGAGDWKPVFDNTGSDAVELTSLEEPSLSDSELPSAPAPGNLQMPDFSPVADALVQANWGQVEASRAFVNAIGSRSMAVQLGSGERAVWASAIGASSRYSAVGGHNGADTNVTGGALGVETQLGESSLLGMALGASRTRVSAHNYGTIKQDTTHFGLYGQTSWNKLSADWSAAYGRSDSEIHNSSWKQNHLQLDGRVSYNHALSSSTVLRGFGGMQYYASDSATVDGIATGSIQNLRAEIGVGASHAIGKLGVYGEVAVHQDLVRHNPTVTTPDARYRGMNTGRTGLNFTVGASYSLTDQWSVNASYTGEIVENATSHSINVGATCKF